MITMPVPLIEMPSPPTHNSLVVRSLLAVTPEYRETVLKDVEYNIFAFPAGLITCDFLSDSGTSAMTDVQWAACKMTTNIENLMPNVPQSYYWTDS